MQIQSGWTVPLKEIVQQKKILTVNQQAYRANFLFEKFLAGFRMHMNTGLELFNSKAVHVAFLFRI